MALSFPYTVLWNTPKVRVRHEEKPSSGVETAALIGKRVVIVEDEGVTQMQLRMVLRRAGLKVVGAVGTGADAIETVLREQPEIVLMDITMPGDIDGLEAMRRILTQMRPCVIMLTAYPEYEEEAMRDGACGYIVKPVDSATLLPQLREAYRQFLER